MPLTKEKCFDDVLGQFGTLGLVSVCTGWRYMIEHVA